MKFIIMEWVGDLPYYIELVDGQTVQGNMNDAGQPTNRTVDVSLFATQGDAARAAEAHGHTKYES